MLVAWWLRRAYKVGGSECSPIPVDFMDFSTSKFYRQTASICRQTNTRAETFFGFFDKNNSAHERLSVRNRDRHRESEWVCVCDCIVLYMTVLCVSVMYEYDRFVFFRSISRSPPFGSIRKIGTAASYSWSWMNSVIRCRKCPKSVVMLSNRLATHTRRHA